MYTWSAPMVSKKSIWALISNGTFAKLLCVVGTGARMRLITSDASYDAVSEWSVDVLPNKSSSKSFISIVDSYVGGGGGSGPSRGEKPVWEGGCGIDFEGNYLTCFLSRLV